MGFPQAQVHTVHSTSESVHERKRPHKCEKCESSFFKVSDLSPKTMQRLASKCLFTCIKTGTIERMNTRNSGVLEFLACDMGVDCLTCGHQLSNEESRVGVFIGDHRIMTTVEQ